MKKLFIFSVIMSVLCCASFAGVKASNSLVGETINFEGYTLNDEKMTSKEIFSANKITMINIWGSWCPPCVNELDELAELHKDLQAKGCGIIALEVEQDTSDATYDKAKKLLQEKGVTYPNIVMPYDSVEFMKNIQAFPTTFFVDSDGQILTEPVVGAYVDKYKSIINELLAKKK